MNLFTISVIHLVVNNLTKINPPPLNIFTGDHIKKAWWKLRNGYIPSFTTMPNRISNM
jgi:hypothetical protein